MTSIQDLMTTLMHNAQKAAGVVPAKASGDNATIPGKATKTAGDGATPAALAGIPKPDEDKSPLAGYGELWQTPAKDQPVDLAKAVTFSLDPTKLMEAAKNLDFTKVIDPALAEKALKGDVNALSAVISSVSQASYVHSATTAAKLIEAALAKQAGAIKEQLPALVRQSQVRDNLQSGDNAKYLEHPAVAPIVRLIESQLTLQYPKASASEITSHVRKVVSGMGDVFSGKVLADDKAAARAGTAGLGDDNWNKFAGIDLGAGLPT